LNPFCLKTSFLIICLTSLFFYSPVQLQAKASLDNYASETGLQSMKVMIAKLRELIFNIKDIDELEKIGLSHADAELMRLALKEKIKQTQYETISIIRSL